MDTQSKKTLWAFLGSALVHVLAVVLILVLASTGYFIWPGQEEDAPQPTHAGVSGAESGGTDGTARDGAGGTAADDQSRVDDMLAQQTARVEQMSPEMQMQALEASAGDLQRVSDRSLRNVAGLAERVSGVGDAQRERAYAPREGVEGTFQADSAALHDIVRKTDDDGRTVYQWTLVDAAGRSMTHDVPESQMSESDMRAFRVYEMSRQNPQLRDLVDAVTRIAEARMEQQEEQRKREATPPE